MLQAENLRLRRALAELGGMASNVYMHAAAGARNEDNRPYLVRTVRSAATLAFSMEQLALRVLRQ
jgi:hypothetical protein